MWPDRFYLTGTDTDLGKTWTAALLCRAFGYSYWKPVQAGLDAETDTELVARLAGVETFAETWRLRRAASPHRAAADEGIRIELAALHAPEAPRLLVEGAGGFRVPFAAEPVLWQADLIRHLKLPVVLVARSGLGTLNHTLLTLSALREDGCSVAGLVLVGAPHRENAVDLQTMGEVTLLAQIPEIIDIDAEFAARVAGLRADEAAR